MSGKDPLVVAAIARIIAKELGVGEGQVAATIQLIEEGASIPFIARYRKERTGGSRRYAAAQSRRAVRISHHPERPSRSRAPLHQ